MLKISFAEKKVYRLENRKFFEASPLTVIGDLMREDTLYSDYFFVVVQRTAKIAHILFIAD